MGDEEGEGGKGEAEKGKWGMGERGGRETGTDRVRLGGGQG